MKVMSTGYEETGRARQKQRTRMVLVAAARDLVESLIRRDPGVAGLLTQAEGADITMELADAFFGERRYEVTDLEGHRWMFGQPV